MATALALLVLAAGSRSDKADGRDAGAVVDADEDAAVALDRLSHYSLDQIRDEFQTWSQQAEVSEWGRELN